MYCWIFECYTFCNYWQSQLPKITKSECACIVITFSFIRRGHMTLSWDESLIFNDRPSLLLKGDHTVILFELLLMSTLPSSCKPWSCMAWGYLRPAVVLRECGVGRPCRVQLYQPPRTWRRDNTPQVNWLYALHMYVELSHVCVCLSAYLSVCLSVCQSVVFVLVWQSYWCMHWLALVFSHETKCLLHSFTENYLYFIM